MSDEGADERGEVNGWERYDCFISYAEEHADRARALAATLVGKRVYVAADDEELQQITDDERIRDRLARALARSERLVVLWDRSVAASGWCNWEILALERRWRTSAGPTPRVVVWAMDDTPYLYDQKLIARTTELDETVACIASGKPAPPWAGVEPTRPRLLTDPIGWAASLGLTDPTAPVLGRLRPPSRFGSRTPGVGRKVAANAVVPVVLLIMLAIAAHFEVGPMPGDEGASRGRGTMLAVVGLAALGLITVLCEGLVAGLAATTVAASVLAVFTTITTVFQIPLTPTGAHETSIAFGVFLGTLVAFELRLGRPPVLRGRDTSWWRWATATLLPLLYALVAPTIVTLFAVHALLSDLDENWKRAAQGGLAGAAVAAVLAIAVVRRRWAAYRQRQAWRSLVWGLALIALLCPLCAAVGFFGNGDRHTPANGAMLGLLAGLIAGAVVVAPRIVTLGRTRSVAETGIRILVAWLALFAFAFVSEGSSLEVIERRTATVAFPLFAAALMAGYAGAHLLTRRAAPTDVH